MKKLALAVSAGAVLAFQVNSASAASTGTGFAISSDGYIVTNNHVITKTVIVKSKPPRKMTVDCSRLTVKGGGYNGLAEVIGRDTKNDLAVLKVERLDAGAPPPANTPKLSNRRRFRSLSSELASNPGRDASTPLPDLRTASRSPARDFVQLNLNRVEPGMPIRVVGFPLGSGISDELKVTSGIVVSPVGIGNDSSRFQMDAATNPGNSGGPVLDQNGNLIGVAVQNLSSQLMKQGVPVVSGFAFAIKSRTVEDFLRARNIPFTSASSGREISIQELYKRAREYVVLIKCE